MRIRNARERARDRGIVLGVAHVLAAGEVYLAARRFDATHDRDAVRATLERVARRFAHIDDQQVMVAIDAAHGTLAAGDDQHVAATLGRLLGRLELDLDPGACELNLVARRH